MFHVKQFLIILFADTEVAEDNIKQVFHIDASGDLADFTHGEANILDANAHVVSGDSELAVTLSDPGASVDRRVKLTQDLLKGKVRAGTGRLVEVAVEDAEVAAREFADEIGADGSGLRRLTDARRVRLTSDPEPPAWLLAQEHADRAERSPWHHRLLDGVQQPIRAFTPSAKR